MIFILVSLFNMMLPSCIHSTQNSIILLLFMADSNPIECFYQVSFILSAAVGYGDRAKSEVVNTDVPVSLCFVTLESSCLYPRVLYLGHMTWPAILLVVPTPFPPSPPPRQSFSVVLEFR